MSLASPCFKIAAEFVFTKFGISEKTRLFLSNLELDGSKAIDIKYYLEVDCVDIPHLKLFRVFHHHKQTVDVTEKEDKQTV